MNAVIDDVRKRVHARGFAEIADVEQVQRIAEEDASAELQVLIGDLIQLLEEPGNYQLADAERAYLRALDIAPSETEVLVSLGYFYDAVMDDPARAKPFFGQAAVLGSSEAQEGLQRVLEQLRDG